MPKAPEGFDVRTESFRGLTRSVLTIGAEGPPVIVLHELFGMTDTVAAFCRMIAEAGFQVFAPVLFGTVEPVTNAAERAGRAALAMCVAGQFRALAADQSGPWADWLRDLVGKVCQDTGKDGVGVVGLCLTGDFALSMAMDKRVKAPVLSEPSLPFFKAERLHVTPAELAAVKARIADPNDALLVRGYRYETDTICPKAKFVRLEQELGAGFEGCSIPASKKLHSVFTGDLRDESGALRHNKVEEVLTFFRDRLTTT